MTLSGMGFAFCQMMSERRYQPSARNAKASSHGTPIMSFALQPSTLPLRATVCPVLPLGYLGSRASP